MSESRNLRFPKWLNWLQTPDLFFFLSYGLFLTTSLLSTSFYYRYFMNIPLLVMQIVCAVLLLLHEIRCNRLRGQHWIGFVVTMVLACIGFTISSGNLLRLVPMMFLYIYCARNIHFAKIARFSLNLSIAVVCLVVCSGYLGIIDNVVVAKGSRIREYMGFRYALYLPGLLLNMTGLWVYLHKDKPTITGSVFWAVINLLVYIKTDSRISFALALVLLAAGLAMHFLPKAVEKIRALWAVLVASYAVCGAVSVGMTAVYDSNIAWMRKLNAMLESRLSLGKKSLVDKGVGLFAQRISWVGNGLDAAGNSVIKVYTYVDCLYVKILQRYGIVFTSALLSLATWAMYRLWKQREYLLLLICATVAVHCVLDDLSFSLHYNTFWIALGTVLMNPAMLRWNSDPCKIQ